MACGVSVIEGALFAEDTLLMSEALQTLGIPIQQNAERSQFIVHGCSGNIPSREASLFVGNAGTAARFLTALLAAAHGRFRVDGTSRMRERPIGPLVEAVRKSGVHVTYEGRDGFLPIQIESDGLTGGDITVDARVSSQFLSGLLMAAPCARAPVTVFVPDEPVSQPYVTMTVRMMQQWGISVVAAPSGSGTRFSVPAPQRYAARKYAVEPDASAASYFMAAAALTGGTVTVPGLSRHSLQGDVRFAEILALMGAQVEVSREGLTITGVPELRGVDVDMNDISDTVMTLTAIAPFCTSATRIRNVEHIRYKECDRITAIATELRRLGANVEEHADGLTIYPSQLRAGVVHTYDDHRMAMAFSLVGLRVPGIEIANPACVAKTFPGFFDELRRLSSGTGQRP